MKLNFKGQAFESFNLLIGVIVALAILVIIFSIIQVFDVMKETSSIESMTQKLENAAQSPDGSVFSSSNLFIKKDRSFNSLWVSEVLNIKEECIEFNLPENVSWAEYSENKKSVLFKKTIETEFYVICDTDCITACNEFCCVLSFGIKP